jgi:hypothetical protein
LHANLYIMRWEQRACALCDDEITNKIFGAIGFDSDHIFENEKDDDKEGSKFFELNSGGIYINRSIYEIIGEIAKTRLVCGDCHECRLSVSKQWRDKYKPPNTCTGHILKNSRATPR